jgi:hypothetical protein
VRFDSRNFDLGSMTLTDRYTLRLVDATSNQPGDNSI